VEVDNLDSCFFERIEKLLSKDVHPPSQYDKVWPEVTAEQLLGQGCIVFIPGFLNLLGIFLPLYLKSVRDQVKILPRDASRLGTLGGICLSPVYDKPDDLGFGYLAVGNGVDEGLKIRAVTAGHNHDTAWFRHGGVMKLGLEIVVCGIERGPGAEAELVVIFRCRRL